METITTQARDLKKGDFVLYTGHLDGNQHELMKVLEVKINTLKHTALAKKKAKDTRGAVHCLK